MDKLVETGFIDKMTQLYLDFTNTMIKRGNEAYLDTKKDKRIAMRLCKYHFYFNDRIGGSAMTPFVCKNCGVKTLHSNTCVPKFCNSCSDHYKVCIYCGGRLE